MKIPDYNKKIKHPTYLEMQEEIERSKDDNKYLNKVNIELSSEKNRLKSIIKEVREYIEKSKSKLPLGINDFTCEMVYSDEVVLANELLEILDKVGKENK